MGAKRKTPLSLIFMSGVWASISLHGYYDLAHCDNNKRFEFTIDPPSSLVGALQEFINPFYISFLKCRLI